MSLREMYLRENERTPRFKCTISLLHYPNLQLSKITTSYDNQQSQRSKLSFEINKFEIKKYLIYAKSTSYLIQQRFIKCLICAEHGIKYKKSTRN